MKISKHLLETSKSLKLPHNQDIWGKSYSLEIAQIHMQPSLQPSIKIIMILLMAMTMMMIGDGFVSPFLLVVLCLSYS